MLSYIHLLNKASLSAYYMTSAVIGTGVITVNKRYKVLTTWGKAK